MTQLGKSTKNIQQIIHIPDTLDSKNYGTLLTSPSFGRFSTNFSVYINERQKQLEAITSQIFDKEKPTYLKDCYYLCNSLLQCTLQNSRFVLLKKPTDRNKTHTTNSCSSSLLPKWKHINIKQLVQETVGRRYFGLSH